MESGRPTIGLFAVDTKQLSFRRGLLGLVALLAVLIVLAVFGYAAIAAALGALVTAVSAVRAHHQGRGRARESEILDWLETRRVGPGAGGVTPATQRHPAGVVSLTPATSIRGDHHAS